MKLIFILFICSLLEVSATSLNQKITQHVKKLTIKKISSTTEQQDSVLYNGRITDESNRPMSGATLKIMGSKRSTVTNSKGNFSIYGPKKGTLEITYIGYQGKQITLNGLINTRPIIVKLVPGDNNLGEVNIVSTGYQDIAKERATGSFEVITKEQLQHSSDPNLIKRLEGITTSLDFNNNLLLTNSANSATSTLAGQLNNSPLAKLTIRGKNTLNSTAAITPTSSSGLALVVIDGVPSPYPIDNVNPNEVESITILKDAAAASIWGARAANGVIVIKTKRGSFNRPTNISFNSNFNITDKINLFYKGTMTTSEFIDAEIYAFNAANTSIGLPVINQPQQFYSPVQEILGSQKRGEITASQAKDQLDQLRNNDIRKDFDKYLIRTSLTQSYSLGVDGGSKKVSYRISAGYDKYTRNTINSDGDRVVLNYNTSIKILKNLDLSATVNYSQRKSNNQSPDNFLTATVSQPFYLYSRLADDRGNHLKVSYKYRPAFLELLKTTYGTNIPDLSYVPLDNINQGYLDTKSQSLNFNLSTNYQLNEILSATILYDYNRGNDEQNWLNRRNSFYVRDLVTRFTTPLLNQQIPFDGIFRPSNNSSTYHSLRGQININKKWSEKSALNAIIGSDVSQTYTLNKDFQYYGYNELTKVSNNQLNYQGQLTTLFSDANGFTEAQIPYLSTSFMDDKLRAVSAYANASYTYNQKYTISGSVRRDLNSQLGMGTNKGGTPFYSFGGSYNLSNENFYHIDVLPRLQFRATFGYNGNVNAIASARPLFITFPVGNNGLPSGTVSTNIATNPKLRPERTAVTNFGLDFGFRNNRISGSLEYYSKRTFDLIAGNVVDLSTGFGNLIYNTANMHGWGTDMTLNSQNLSTGSFTWTSNFLLSYNRVKVTKLFTAAAKTAQQAVFGTPSYNEGYDLSRLFAFRWAGLDPTSGNPRGYYNGQPYIVSNAATANDIYNQPLSEARYFGSAVPVYYGSLRNTFSYGPLSISANLLFKLGYYFRRPASDLTRYATLFNSLNSTVQGAEYSKRWTKPGDELTTNVPAVIYPGNAQKDNFYQYSEINVAKADHIRFQEINFAYSLRKSNFFLKNPRLYANISNLGLVWRANKLGLDPDINDYPNPRTYAIGFSANFY